MNHEKKKAVFEDDNIKHHFNTFCQKIQGLFSEYHRSRHVVFTPVNLRMMYILYLSKIHECRLYKNHHCHLCIIYDRDSIIAMDINTRYPSPDMIKSYMKHAEINAILTMKKTTNSTAVPLAQLGIFITRFSKTSVLNSSNPCFFCARFIKKHIHYFHSISFTDADENMVVMSSDEFIQTEFQHKTQRYKGLIFT
jgi:tRNA(Arg) A34 adenosine deaminase TadA